MARRKATTFTEVELEFMHVIWELGEVSTENMQDTLNDRGRPLSDGSIRKILSILLTKGHVERRRDGRSFYYKPTVDKESARQSMVQDLLKRAFDGSVSLMVASLFDSRGIKDGDIDDVKRMIDSYDGGE